MKKSGARPRAKPWDSAAFLQIKQNIAVYLKAVFEDSDPALLAVELGDVARSKGIGKIVRVAECLRLSKALSRDGGPELDAVLDTLRALGLKLKVIPLVDRIGLRQ